MKAWWTVYSAIMEWTVCLRNIVAGREFNLIFALSFHYVYQFNRHIAVFLLLISTLFLVPKELVHEFTCHTDSTDEPHPVSDSPVVGNMHHHCDILQLFVPPYHAVEEHFQFKNYAGPETRYASFVQAFKPDAVHVFSSRGPPAVSWFFFNDVLLIRPF